MIPILSPILDLGNTIVGGVVQHFKSKQDIKKAITNNRIRLAESEQSHNQDWELKSLDNAGWKDDVLFYAFIAMFIWAGFNPEGAKQFFENLNVLPEWFIKTWLWIVASVLGVKKIGDYAPGMISGIKKAFKK